MEEAQDLMKEQLRRCQARLKLHPKEELLLKATELCRHALSKAKGLEEVSRREALQSFAQSVLDSTYHSECQLVERGFPPDDAHGQMRDIIGTLSVMAEACGSPGAVPLLLGNDLSECLHWRLGALLYMYCHTVMESERRQREMDAGFFMECCCVGVGHLQLMLTCRTPLLQESEAEEVVSLDTSTPQLLRQGIFSDVHMLALMYAGELCYWCWEQQPGGRGRLPQAVPHPPRTESKSNSLKATAVSSTAPEGGFNAACDTSSSSDTPPEAKALSETAASRQQYSQAAWLYQAMEHSQGSEFSSKWAEEFDCVALGQGFLAKYIEVARGPLKPQGWEYDRAVQLLVKLKKGGR